MQRRREPAGAAEEEVAMKTLVAYYNESPDSERMAKRIADATKGDLFEITPAQPYTAADLDWSGKDSRSYLETNDETARPELATEVEDMDSYELIFVGFPIWGYVEPRFIDTFLESYDLSGKRIVPYSDGDAAQAAERIRGLCPAAEVRDGRRINTTDTDATLFQWLAPLTR